MEKSKSIESILAENADTKIKENLSFGRKALLILKNISVEPIMIFFILPSVMASLATQNLNLEKACRVNLKFDQNICDALSERNTTGFTKNDEAAVQKLVAMMNAWKNVIQSLIPTVLLLYLGSWSDRHDRRKPVMIAPIIGEITTCLGFLICTYFFYQLPMEFNAFFESVPPALTGGWFAMFMGVFSYVSSKSNVETRTLRIGAVNLFANVSITIGIALSGILYKKIGFYGVFSLALGMHCTALLYGCCVVKETSKNIKGKDEIKVNACFDFFNTKHVKETFKMAFKNDGEKNKTKRICLLLVLVMLIIGPTHGELNVMYLFVRYKFGWNEIDYSLFSTFHFVFHIMGTVFSLMFFSKYLKLDDAVLGMISCTSKILACIVYAFAPTGTILYIGALVEILDGCSIIAVRSIMSKMVPSDQLGKINSLLGVAEALMPLVYGPMYSTIYKITIKYLPGAFHLFGGLLTVPAVVIYFWFYRQHKKDKNSLNRTEKGPQETNELLSNK